MRFFYHHHGLAQGASFDIHILLNTVLEVYSESSKEILQGLIPQDQVRTGPMKNEYKQGGPRRPEKSGVWEREPQEMTPIPFVPVIHEVQEAVSKGKEYSYKIKLPNKTEFSVPIWDTGTQEAFLIHVQQAKSACRRKELFKDYDDALEAESKSIAQVKSLRRAIANAKKMGATEPNPSSQDE